MWLWLLTDWASFSLIPSLLIPVYLLIRSELLLSLGASRCQSGFVTMPTSQASPVWGPLPFKGNERLRGMKLLLSGSLHTIPPLFEGSGKQRCWSSVLRVPVARGEDGQECVQRCGPGGGESSGCLVAARAPRGWLLQTLIAPSLKQGSLRNLFLRGGLCWEGKNRC